MSEKKEENKFLLQEAARDGKALTVRSLLRENPRLVQRRDLDGRVALHWAVSSNHQEIVAMLLNPLLIANAEEKKFSKFEIEIDDLVDDAGWTPLHIAAALGNLEIIELLITHDPEPTINQQTNAGQTVLHLSASKNLYETTAYFLKHGASARVKDKKGQYPIFRAASIGSIRLVELLCTEGKSQLNNKDNFGWTILHHALAEGHGDVAIELVKRGANPNIESGDGQTPVEVSVDQKIEKYFRQHLEDLGIELEKSKK
ncbi:Nas6 protein [Saccharomycopsis crataegensis]|uniref:Nas6 protein n=1 Tax=Saccharomycopsis crataegensis TaxID=43959 RepID=A0AAV5QUR0_9ASCO|nr:Nas6 protein [Saccharomycopsis crataegensis]